MIVKETIIINEYENYFIEIGLNTWMEEESIEKQEESTRNRFNMFAVKFHFGI